MLKTCSSLLLLTDVDSFTDTISAVCEDYDVALHTYNEWNDNYRVREDVILCGSKYLEQINKAYYPSVVLILKKDESFVSYAQMGINRFIFNHTDIRELYYALMHTNKVCLKEDDGNLKTVLEDSNSTDFIHGNYVFHFGTDKFYYKGKEVYLTKGAKVYLADWLLNGKKDNGKRMYIYNLRKAIGEEFLRDVDRHGQYTGGEDE